MRAADPSEELERLLDARTTAHRLAASPMSSLGELEDWLAGLRIALVSGRSALPSAAEAIAGCPIEGSWWGHPEGSRIYRLLNELEGGASGYADLALVEGKRTLLAASLLPVAAALAADAGRRRRVIEGLRAPARRLLDALASGRVVRSDDHDDLGKDARSARRALEAGLLARSRSIHTASGRHVSLLEPYGDDGSPGAATVAAEPLSELLAAGLSACVVAERREIDGWFRFVEPDAKRRSDALDHLATRTLARDGRIWLTSRQ
ncbi:MAG: hypothetical protein ACLQNG_17415 [Acidimicrobiales bacterium]|jgi:hypothetical protein